MKDKLNDATDRKATTKVPRSVFALGLVSFFSDISSEMVYPLIPFFLKSVLGAGSIAIGLIEGVAESTAALANLFSGWLSDRLGRRKGLAIFGYALAALMRPIIGISTAWQHVLAARFTDRVGKGIRTSPRDALIAQSAPQEIRGRAFGIQRAMDHAGAVLGPLVAMGVLSLLGSPLIGTNAIAIPEINYRRLFMFAFIPGLLGVVILWLGVKEKAVPRNHDRPLPSINLKTLKGPFGLFCLVATLFAIGNSSNMFLLLRAQDLGLSVGLVPAGYVLIYIGASIFSAPAGALSDRLGRRWMLIIGYLLSAAVYAGFAVAQGPGATWILFAFYGLYIAVTDGMQRAYAADLAPKGLLGTALGTFNTVTGVALLPASIIAGALWSISPAWPFWFGGMSGLLAGVLLLWLPLGQQEVP